jgi:uncharacterized membrane protein
MNWTQDALNKLPVRDKFRLRSENMTRLEVFSDTAFAFAMTMLVVSVGSVPENYNELVLALKSVPAFFLSFCQIAFFWWAHRSWSQRFGLESTPATILTLAMIFTVLVYVYPLRLIYSSLCAFMSNDWLPSEYKIQSVQEVASLFAIYGVGYFVLTTIMCLLYGHALRQKELLGLNEYEFEKTRTLAITWRYHPIFGLLCTATALFAPPVIGALSGFIFVGLFVLIPIHRRVHARRHPILATKN